MEITDVKNLAIKTILILIFIFYNCIFAQYEDGFIDASDCEILGIHTHVDINKYKGKNGITKINKYIRYYDGPHPSFYASYSYAYEEIVTIHDKKNSLLFSKHYTWEDSLLIQTIDSGVVRNIIKGKTPCDYVIIEPSGDSVSFRLDPRKKFNHMKDQSDFIAFMHGYKILLSLPRFDSSKYDVYDAIAYKRQHFCKRYYDSNRKKGRLMEFLFNSSSSFSNAEKESEVSIENDGNSLYNILLYKYYAVFIIGIAVICIIVVRKRRKRE